MGAELKQEERVAVVPRTYASCHVVKLQYGMKLRHYEVELLLQEEVEDGTLNPQEAMAEDCMAVME